MQDEHFGDIEKQQNEHSSAFYLLKLVKETEMKKLAERHEAEL